MSACTCRPSLGEGHKQRTEAVLPLLCGTDKLIIAHRVKQRMARPTSKQGAPVCTLADAVAPFKFRTSWGTGGLIRRGAKGFTLKSCTRPSSVVVEEGCQQSGSEPARKRGRNEARMA